MLPALSVAPMTAMFWGVKNACRPPPALVPNTLEASSSVDRPLAVLIPTSSGRDRRRDATIHETVDDVCGTRCPSQEHPQRARDRLGTDTPPPARPDLSLPW